jgi:hypothetical protein
VLIPQPPRKRLLRGVAGVAFGPEGSLAKAAWKQCETVSPGGNAKLIPTCIAVTKTARTYSTCTHTLVSRVLFWSNSKDASM